MSGHVQQSSWKLRGRVGSADEDYDDDETSYLAALTDHAAYARSLGFPEPFPEYVSHLDESEVQERLNRMSTCLPVDSHFAFQPLLKIGPCSRWFKMSNVFPILFHLICFVLFF